MAAPTQVDALSSLLTTLGGSTVTKSAGNTDALQSALAQLQGNNNYEALLKSVFQKASGQIPGLQAAYGNAIGARSGGNSAVQSALNALMSQTALSGQSQIATQQQNNLNAQVQAGNSIAQATTGTKTTTGNNLTEAAKNLAILQLLSKTGIMQGLGLGTQQADAAPVSNQNMGMVAPVDNFVARQPDFGSPVIQSADMSPFTNPTGALDGFYGNEVASGPQPSMDFGNGGYSPEIDWNAVGAAQTSDSPAMTEDPLQNEWMNFADGGIVRGRGRTTAQMEPSDMPAAETAEEEGEARSNARFDAGFTANVFMDTFRQLLNVNGTQSFADGGLVTQRAAGGRRSSAPSVQTTAPDVMTANNMAGAMPQLSAQPGTLSSIAPQLQLALNSGGGSGNGSPSFSGSGATASTGVQRGLSTAATVNSLSGLTGGKSVPGGMLGMAAGLSRAKSPEEALGVMGKTALGIAAPQASTLLSAFQNPSQVNLTNLALSLNPLGAVANGTLGLFGTSIGQVALGTEQSAAKNGDVTEATMGLLGGGGQFGGQPAMSSPTTPQGSVVGTDLGQLATSPSFGNYGGGSGGTNGGSNPGGGGQPGFGGNPGRMANGGPVNGRGTGTSDSVKANLSDGEFVMSADVVDALGENFFNQLQAAFHVPAAMQRA